MSGLSTKRAALLAAILAVVVYANAHRNGWAVDDYGVVAQNQAAHSIGAAWKARFAPYWPVIEHRTAGHYRPAAIMSYAIDWTISGGRPGWFHMSNVLLHALVTALVVFVVAAWLRPSGALVAGLVFAVHPVHVEAVANVVGRAEILAAAGILGAVLTFRRYRTAPSAPEASGWLVATLALAVLALLTKEHAAVAVVILGLDAFLHNERSKRSVFGPLVAVTAITFAWFVVWQGVAGAFVETSTATTLRYLNAGQRAATMLPVFLDVARLLTWPMELAHDYNPQVIPQRTEFTALAALGLVTSGAIVALAILSVRRAPAIAFGILVGLVTYAPTSNLVFAAGTLLGERTLYLAVLVPAMLAGWVITSSKSERGQRIALIGVTTFLIAYSGRTFTRTPFWLSSENVVIEGWGSHPENFRTHVQLGRMFERAGAPDSALAEYLLAGVLFDRDPFVPVVSGPVALSLGRTRVAVQEAERAWSIAPGHPAITGLLVEAYEAAGLSDSALAIARTGIELAPVSRTAATIYLGLLESRNAARWQMHLAEARLDWLNVRLGSVTAKLDTVQSLIGSEANQLDGFCWEFGNIMPVVRTLYPELEETARTTAEAAGIPCDFGS